MSKDQADYIRYGLDVMLSTLLNLLCILMVSLLMGELLLGMVFIFVFVPIRSFTGGYHADTKIRCNLSLIGVLVVAIMETRMLVSCRMNTVVVTNLLIYLLLVAILAPVENHNKTLSEGKKCRNKCFVSNWCFYCNRKMEGKIVSKKKCRTKWIPY